MHTVMLMDRAGATFAVELNGTELAVAANDALPQLEGARVPAGNVAVAPLSVTFLAVAEAGNANCR